MAANIISLEDLRAFKDELLEEIRNLLSHNRPAPTRKWLKSYEVRRLLTIFRLADHI